MHLSLETIEEQAYVGHIRSTCAYLPDRQSNLLFLDGGNIGLLYRLLLDQGYRRHGTHLYRPDCGTCRECRVLRIPVDTFAMTRNQKRVWKKSVDRFTVKINRPTVNAERTETYAAYLAFQHENTTGIESLDYEEFFTRTCLDEHTMEAAFFDNESGLLAGVGILDRLGDALSSVYFYFHPDFAAYSPGTFSVLYELSLARSWGLRYYYPGYYIAGCASMRYKANFGPNELRAGTGWEPGKNLPGT